jgi:hypothetical protein
LVVFDLSITATPLDCDVYVQYWIDLIQARAPGSTIVVVGTHADRLTAEQERDRVEMVKARIKSNEEQRVADLRKDVEGCRNADKRDTLRRTLEKRPVIDADILAMARGDAERVLADIHMLSCRIVQLATPTAAKPHPLSTINTVLPDFYLTVKDCMNVLKSENKAFCTVHELEQLILSKRAGSSGSLHDLAGERTGRSVLRETKMAVAHWANVGEVSLMLYFFSTVSGTFSSNIFFRHVPICRLCGSPVDPRRVRKQRRSMRLVVFQTPRRRRAVNFFP